LGSTGEPELEQGGNGGEGFKGGADRADGGEGGQGMLAFGARRLCRGEKKQGNFHLNGIKLFIHDLFFIVTT